MSHPLDSQNMFETVAATPDQVVNAMNEARGLDGLPERDEVEHVVVLGMGGSGIAGDVLQTVASPFIPVPVVVVKGYELPAFVGEGSLVFAISFSGNTEEALETATVAANQGARMVAIASGGELAQLANGWGAPLIGVPDNIPQPRAGLAAMAIPPLVVLEEIGLFIGAKQWIDLAVEQLRRRSDELSKEANMAREIADRIGSTIPLIHGGGALGATAAQRWKTQVNENAKSPAFWAAQPELCHNEVLGWEQHSDVVGKSLSMVGLRHDSEHPQVTRRFSIVQDLFGDKMAEVVNVQAEGDGDLAQLMDLIMVGDFTTLHMAVNAGIDPGPVPAIAKIKKSLAEG